MIGTYAAALAVCVASLAIGQALIVLCGRRRWSWASAPVGLAMLGAVCWATVRLPGHGSISAIVVLLLVAASLAYLQGKGVWHEGFTVGWPVAVLAAIAASLPFIVEGHFGILGTSFNPDMSQHLLAADQLAHGHSGQLIHQGYPLGPHSIVVALDKGLDIGLVKGFSGLSVAVAVLAPLTALAAFRELRPAPRTAAALVVGLAYVVASYFAQGAFKETMLALFLLGFVLCLRETWREPVDSRYRFVPAALIAAGSIYVYSFPGLLWLLGTAVIWAIVEGAIGWLRDAERVRSGARELLRPALIAIAALVVLVAPEIGRMIDFHKFETFDPNGPGLGNLFGQISPFEALGIWPSGDFRLAPGDGAVPAAAYYLGAAFGTVLLLDGIWACWRRRETVLLSGLFVAAVAYLAARVGGTAYTSAKAIEIAAPLCALTILLPLTKRAVWSLPLAIQEEGSTAAPPAGGGGGPVGGADPSGADRGGLIAAAASVVFIAVAGLCSALALANAPVGPPNYSPALTGFRPLVANGSTVVLASPELLEDDHGTNYIAWELRGGRVCIETRAEAEGSPPPGVRFVVTQGSRHKPPFKNLRLRRARSPYVLWEVKGPVAAQSVCPLIAVRQARQGRRAERLGWRSHLPRYPRISGDALGGGQPAGARKGCGRGEGTPRDAALSAATPAGCGRHRGGRGSGRRRGSAGGATGSGGRRAFRSRRREEGHRSSGVTNTWPTLTTPWCGQSTLRALTLLQEGQSTLREFGPLWGTGSMQRAFRAPASARSLRLPAAASRPGRSVAATPCRGRHGTPGRTAPSPADPPRTLTVTDRSGPDPSRYALAW